MASEWRQVRVLLMKDVWLHGRSMVAFVGLILGAYGLLLASAPWLFPDQRLRALVSLLFFPFFLFGGLMSSMWLVETERMKGTFALMRSLPVSDRAIVASKLLVASGLHLLAGSLGIVLLIPDLLRAEHIGFCPVLLGALVTFGNLSVLTRLRFGARVGAALPFLILLLFSLVVIAAMEHIPGAEAQLVESVRARPTALVWLAGEATVNVSMWMYLARWLPTNDTSDLIE